MVSIEVDGLSIGLNAVLIRRMCTFGSLFYTDSVGNENSCLVPDFVVDMC